MQTFQKQPNDVLDYDVDLSTWFADIPSDDINAVAITVRSDAEAVPTLVVGALPHPGYTLMGTPAWRIKLWLSGGTSYTDYVVTCLVKTEQDRTKEVEFKIKVRDL